MVSELKTTLGTVEFVAITTDSWTALTTESYVTITCNFIADSKVNSCVLQTRALEERHSAANLADYLKTSVEQWGLDGKVVATTTKLADAKTLELIDDHWQTIEEILPVLHSVKIASEALGGENYVSVSMVYPLVQSLLSRHLQMSGGESQKVNEFKNTVAASLKQRINIANLQNAGKTPLLASALDPRHKHLRFLDENMREAVREKLFEQYQSISFDVRGAGAAVAAAAACVPASDGDESVPVPSHRRRLSLFFGEDYRESSRDEWEPFLMEPCIPPDEDPMNWWQDNTKRFKKLGRLAHRYLCVPATSVPAERVFSAAGLIVNRLRCRLSPEHVDMLVFLNKNM
ncbi:unnamed protein product [Leuciscus chuanchicus]